MLFALFRAHYFFAKLIVIAHVLVTLIYLVVPDPHNAAFTLLWGSFFALPSAVLCVTRISSGITLLNIYINDQCFIVRF